MEKAIYLSRLELLVVLEALKTTRIAYTDNQECDATLGIIDILIEKADKILQK